MPCFSLRANARTPSRVFPCSSGALAYRHHLLAHLGQKPGQSIGGTPERVACELHYERGAITSGGVPAMLLRRSLSPVAERRMIWACAILFMLTAWAALILTIIAML